MGVGEEEVDIEGDLEMELVDESEIEGVIEREEVIDCVEVIDFERD